MSFTKMQRLGILAVGIVGAIVHISSPVSGLPPVENLFPTGKGSTWHYKGVAVNAPIEMDATIDSVELSGGTTAVHITWSTEGKTSQEETYLVTSNSVERAKSGQDGSNVIEPAVPIIKYPVKVGKSWAWTGKMKIRRGQATGELPASATIKVTSRESVKTPAGKFYAYRIDMLLSVAAGGKKQNIPNIYWYAPGVGLVRQKMTLTAPNGQQAIIEATVTKYSIKK